MAYDYYSLEIPFIVLRVVQGIDSANPSELHPEVYNYRLQKWELDVDQWWRHFMNSNWHDEITEEEAKSIIEGMGGKFHD